MEGLIRAKVQVESAANEKAFLEQPVKYCRSAREATGEWEALMKIDREQLPSPLNIRCSELARRGRFADMAQAAAKLREWKSETKSTLCNAACGCGVCAAKIVKGKAKPTDDDRAQQRKYIDQSIACLKEAIAAGYKDFRHMKDDDDLAELRELPDFKALFPKK